MCKKIKTITIAIIFLSLMISTSFFSKNNYTVVADEEEEKTIVWFCSDAHIGYTSAFKYDLWDACNDTEEIGAEYAFHIGDAIHNLAHPGTSIQSMWSDFNSAWNTLDVTYKNLTVGNHDGNWKTYSSITKLNYTYQMGNVLFVILGDEFIDGETNDSTPGAGGEYLTQIDWLNETIQENSNKNIILLIHHTLRDTTYSANGLSDSDYFINMFTWLNESGYHVNAWLHGHKHLSQNAAHGDMIVYNSTYNVTHNNIGTVCNYPSDGGTLPPESVYYNFTQDSNQVTVTAYNHDTDTFYSNDDYPHTLNLSYPFDLIVNDVSIQSINDKGNEIESTEVYRHLKWSKCIDTKYYNLQIANDSEFSDVFYNNTDINSTNYGSEYYYESSNYVCFNITNIFSEGAKRGDTHYYRVRAYVGE